MKRNTASIYIHWPFCTKLCNYCNFNKYVNTDSKLPNQLVKCLKIEGKTILKKANINKISTIYFGGGTPSLIPPEKIKEVIDEYLEVTSQENTEEITLEINPSKEINQDKMQQFIDAGITRFSIGLQSIDDKVLKWMNRDHNGALAEKVINASRDLSGLHSSSIGSTLIHFMTSHYSKSQIFVQKFNFDKTPTFLRVFHTNFFDNFSR